MNPRFLTALAVGTVTFGGVFAFAATLDVSSDNLGAGDQLVASCDTDGITTSYDVAYDDVQSRWEITDVTLEGVDAACAGQTASVTLTKAGGTTVGTAGGAIDATEETFSVADAATGASAEDVVGVHVVITGAASPASE